jgi:succinate-acetate transporter protein
MLQIILLIVGIVVLSQKSIKLTNKKELKRPQSIYLGSFLILWALFSFFIDFGPYSPMLFVIPFFVAIISTFFAKEIEVVKEEREIEE